MPPENTPFCPHGYIYANESGLYYLQSRYYDPATCRFINADTFTSTGQGVLGNNMFAYCQNNPVMRFDPTGEISAALIVVVVICAVAGGIMGAQFEGELEPETPQPEDYSKPKKHHLTPNNPNVQAEPNETHQDEKKLTTGDRIKNGIIGAGLGAAVGGAVMAFIGAGASVITGSATTYISALGGTGVQTFALGAAIYDIFAVIFSSLFGVEMEPIEIEP